MKRVMVSVKDLFVQVSLCLHDSYVTACYFGQTDYCSSGNMKQVCFHLLYSLWFLSLEYINSYVKHWLHCQFSSTSNMLGQTAAPFSLLTTWDSYSYQTNTGTYATGGKNWKNDTILYVTCIFKQGISFWVTVTSWPTFPYWVLQLRLLFGAGVI